MNHGFYKALIGDNNHNECQKLENIAYNELLRRDYEITVRIYGDLEIDLICKKKLHDLCSSFRNFKRIKKQEKENLHHYRILKITFQNI